MLGSVDLFVSFIFRCVSFYYHALSRSLLLCFVVPRFVSFFLVVSRSISFVFPIRNFSVFLVLSYSLLVCLVISCSFSCCPHFLLLCLPLFVLSGFVSSFLVTSRSFLLCLVLSRLISFLPVVLILSRAFTFRLDPSRNRSLLLSLFLSRYAPFFLVVSCSFSFCLAFLALPFFFLGLSSSFSFAFDLPRYFWSCCAFFALCFALSWLVLSLYFFDVFFLSVLALPRWFMSFRVSSRSFLFSPLRSRFVLLFLFYLFYPMLSRVVRKSNLSCRFSLCICLSRFVSFFLVLSRPFPLKHVLCCYVLSGCVLFSLVLSRLFPVVFCVTINSPHNFTFCAALSHIVLFFHVRSRFVSFFLDLSRVVSPWFTCFLVVFPYLSPFVSLFLV